MHYAKQILDFRALPVYSNAFFRRLFQVFLTKTVIFQGWNRKILTFEKSISGGTIVAIFGDNELF